MRGRPAAHRDQAYLVTEAPQSRAAEINQRQRRYLLMMGLRLVCFVITVVLFVNHGGWLTVIPAMGAIALPYFAVVIANSRQPVSSSGFRPYEPNLPQPYSGSADGGIPGSPGSPGSDGFSGDPGMPPSDNGK